MDKRELQNLSQPVTDVYLGIEEQILLNIAKRLAKHNSLLTEDDIQSWQVQALSELEGLSQKNIQFMSSKSGKTIEEVRKALEKAGYNMIEDNEKVLQRAAKEGLLNEAPPVAESAAIASILESYERQSQETLNLVNSTMLNQSEQAYLDIINRTTGEVLSGVSTPQQALRKTVGEWAETGTPALIDKAGKRWSSEAYISTVMRSTSNNVANDMQEARFDEYGNDLVEISSHSGARPKCAPYQGRIFSRSGNHPRYPALNDTSIGEPDGLFGINCGHVKYAYIEGISKQRYKPRDPEVNDKAYERSQKQRYLERQIKKAKREKAMLEELGDTEGIERAQRKILNRQDNMRQFIKSTNRTRRREREQIS